MRNRCNDINVDGIADFALTDGPTDRPIDRRVGGRDMDERQGDKLELGPIYVGNFISKTAILEEIRNDALK
jgi:hypothetical protein